MEADIHVFVCVHNNAKIERSCRSSRAAHQRQLVGCLRAHRFPSIIHKRVLEREREHISDGGISNSSIYCRTW